MAQQEATVTETNQKAAQRLLAGEQLGAVLGLSELQVQGFAALGYNLYQQGQLKEAEKLFRGVTAFDSKSYLGYAGLGAVALATKPPNLDAAYTNLTKALELKPTDASVQANLGEVLLRQGKLEEAKKHLERAFQLDPGHNDPGANRARALVSGLDMIVKELQSRMQAQGKPVAKAS
jgi:tetratricopeptide (TPR) repeat protein